MKMTYNHTHNIVPTEIHVRGGKRKRGPPVARKRNDKHSHEGVESRSDTGDTHYEVYPLLILVKSTQVVENIIEFHDGPVLRRSLRTLIAQG